VAVVATLSKGYDLEYIWRQVDRGPAKDAAGYYIQASETGGEPPGRWWGPGALALGLKPGPALGALLAEIREKQLQDELKTRAEAKRWAKERLGEMRIADRGSRNTE